MLKSILGAVLVFTLGTTAYAEINQDIIEKLETMKVDEGLIHLYKGFINRAQISDDDFFELIKVGHRFKAHMSFEEKLRVAENLIVTNRYADQTTLVAADMIQLRQYYSKGVDTSQLLERAHLELLLRNKRTTSTDVLLFIYHSRSHSKLMLEHARKLASMLSKDISLEEIVQKNPQISPIFFQLLLKDYQKKLSEDSLLKTITKFLAVMPEFGSSTERRAIFNMEVYNLLDKVDQFELMTPLIALKGNAYSKQRNKWIQLFKLSADGRGLNKDMRILLALNLANTGEMAESPLKFYFDVVNNGPTYDLSKTYTERLTRKESPEGFKLLLESITTEHGLRDDDIRLLLKNADHVNENRVFAQNALNYLLPKSEVFLAYDKEGQKRYYSHRVAQLYDLAREQGAEAVEEFSHLLHPSNLELKNLNLEAFQAMFRFYGELESPMKVIYEFSGVFDLLNKRISASFISEQEARKLIYSAKEIVEQAQHQDVIENFNEMIKDSFPFVERLEKEEEKAAKEAAAKAAYEALSPIDKAKLISKDLNEDNFFEKIKKITNKLEELKENLSRVERDLVLNDFLNQAISTKALNQQFQKNAEGIIEIELRKWLSLYALFESSDVPTMRLMSQIHKIIGNNANSIPNALNLYTRFNNLKRGARESEIVTDASFRIMLSQIARSTKPFSMIDLLDFLSNENALNNINFLSSEGLINLLLENPVRGEESVAVNQEQVHLIRRLKELQEAAINTRNDIFSRDIHFARLYSLEAVNLNGYKHKMYTAKAYEVMVEIYKDNRVALEEIINVLQDLLDNELLTNYEYEKLAQKIIGIDSNLKKNLGPLSFDIVEVKTVNKEFGGSTVEIFDPRVETAPEEVTRPTKLYQIQEPSQKSNKAPILMQQYLDAESKQRKYLTQILDLGLPQIEKASPITMPLEISNDDVEFNQLVSQLEETWEEELALDDQEYILDDPLTPDEMELLEREIDQLEEELEQELFKDMQKKEPFSMRKAIKGCFKSILSLIKK